jgi:lysophospholipase L1-like esterase
MINQNFIHKDSEAMSTKERQYLLFRVSNFVPLLLLLAGCGGGGSSNDGPQPVLNSPPVAQNDSASTPASTPVKINVVSNDSDSDGAIVPNTVTLVKLPASGSINNHRDGTITYTPNAGFGGATDSFTYTVEDDDGAVSNEATVTITVTAVNTPPTAKSLCGKTPANTPFTSNLSSLVSDNESSEFVFRVIDQPNPLGTADLLANGMLTYTPNPDVRGKADTFTYEVEDPDGATASGEIKVIIGDTLVMPFGDSITAGIFGNGLPRGTEDGTTGPREASLRIGYRKKLNEDMNNPAIGGFQVDFVGERQDGQGAGLLDDDHEGFPGRTTAEAGAKIKAWLDNNSNNVDVVLMHLGSNDVNDKGFQPEVSVSDAEAILDDIQAWEDTHHTVTVSLALITDRLSQFHQAFPNPDVENLNNQLRAMANRRITGLGDKIVIVNQHDALTYPDDLDKSDHPDPGVKADKVHPNQGGYNKMASTWFQSLVSEEAAIPRCEPTP